MDHPSERGVARTGRPALDWKLGQSCRLPPYTGLRLDGSVSSANEVGVVCLSAANPFLLATTVSLSFTFRRTKLRGAIAELL